MKEKIASTPRDSHYWSDISNSKETSYNYLLDLVGCRVYQEGRGAPIYLVHYNSFMKRPGGVLQKSRFDAIKEGLGIDMLFLKNNSQRMEKDMTKAIHLRKGDVNVMCLNGSAHVKMTDNKEVATCPRCLATDTNFW